MINKKEISDCLKSLFLCTGRIRRFAAELHVPRAASRRNKSPLPDSSFALLFPASKYHRQRRSQKDKEV